MVNESLQLCVASSGTQRRAIFCYWRKEKKVNPRYTGDRTNIRCVAAPRKSYVLKLLFLRI